MSDPTSPDEVRDALAALREHAEVPHTGPACAVQRVVLKLYADNPETALAVWDACDDVSITPLSLATYLRETFGERVTPYTLRRHRRRLLASSESCRCPR